jgi:hypothetical protein
VSRAAATGHTPSARHGRAGDEPGVVVGVGIAPASLGYTFGGDEALRRVAHEELLDELALHATLVFSSVAELEEFRTALAQLPVGLAKRWEALLSGRRLIVDLLEPEAAPGIGEALDPAELEASVSGPVRLVLLERDQASLLGVAGDAYAAMAPGGRLEMGRLATGTRTETLQRASRLLTEPLREGDDREKLWRERFGPLVEVSKTVVVYDRYAGIQAARRYVHGERNADGLTWFVSRVALTPGKRVRLITAVTDDDKRVLDERTVAPALQVLRDRLADRDVRLDVVLVPDRGERGDRFGHDRHLRFDERVALSLGPGLQAFAWPKVKETIVVARLPITDAKAREAAAERAQRRPPPQGWVRHPVR